MRYVVFNLLFCASCAVGQVREDTTRLLTHLGHFRSSADNTVEAEDYKALRAEFAVWMDTRMRSGISPARMNEELRTATLLTNTDDAQAGYVEEVVDEPIAGANDVSALRSGINLDACNVDETVTLYRRSSGERIATLNAQDEYTHGYILRAIDAGIDSNGHGRMVGSEWVASSCSSNWNGNILRIDLAGDAPVRNILTDPLEAYLSEDLDLSVRGQTVALHYSTSVTFPGFDIRAAIRRYRIEGSRITRLAPIARSHTGFVDEWLKMDDEEAARWSSPEAAAKHHATVVILGTQFFGWASAAMCSDFPPVLELEMASDSDVSVVFAISGTTAGELYMVDISDDTSDGCRELEIQSLKSPLPEQSPR